MPSRLVAALPAAAWCLVHALPHQYLRGDRQTLNERISAGGDVGAEGRDIDDDVMVDQGLQPGNTH